MLTCNSEKFAVMWSFAVFPEDMDHVSCNVPQEKNLRGSTEQSSFNNTQKLDWARKH